MEHLQFAAPSWLLAPQSKREKRIITVIDRLLVAMGRFRGRPVGKQTRVMLHTCLDDDAPLYDSNVYTLVKRVGPLAGEPSDDCAGWLVDRLVEARSAGDGEAIARLARRLCEVSCSDEG